MSDLLWFYLAIGVLALLCVALFLHQQHTLRDARELSDDLSHSETQLQQLTQKYERLSLEKGQLEQWAVQQQTKLEASLERLEERDQFIARQQQKLLAAEQEENRLAESIHALKERVGSAESRAESLAQQLSDKQQLADNLQLSLSQSRQELATLQATLSEKQANFEQQQRQFFEVRQQLNVEFQHLAQQILEEKSKHFAESNQSSLDLLLKPLKEQIEGFQKRVNEVHSESLKGNAGLSAEIKRVLEVGLSMSQEAQNLTSALKGNNKVAGNWGEMQLETALQAAGLLAGEHYLAQQGYKDEQGRRFNPDFVVKLPDNKHLILDSKVSLLAYEQAVGMTENLAISQALDEHCRSLRNHIDGLSKKNYSHLIGLKSPDFVLMFIPIEPAYIEALKHDPKLFNDAYERNVILVSHTTLMPILRTVANLWRIERGNAEAREISEKAGEIYNQVCTVAERLMKLGNTLNTANNQYNQTVTSLVGKQGLLGKVERFRQISGKAAQSVPQVEFISGEVDTLKLEAVICKENEQTDRLLEEAE